MAKAIKDRPLVAEEPQPGPLNGIAHGYLPAARPRYRWVTCDWTDSSDDPDGEPFRARIRCNLTWGEIDGIDLVGSLTFTDLWAILAPHVIEWNALGRDAVTGEIVPVPPPAVAGPSAFHAIEAGLTLWLATQIKTAHLGGEERGKGVSTPGVSDERPVDED